MMGWALYLNVLLILGAIEVYGNMAGDECVGSDSICYSEPPFNNCTDTEAYDSKSGNCLSLVDQACHLNSDCAKNAYCKPELNTTLGKFVSKCACLINFYRTEGGLCSAASQYGEFCDSSQPCQTNSPLMSCLNNTCACSQVFDPFKKTCVLEIGEPCYEHRSIHSSICVTNAFCSRIIRSKSRPVKCQCAVGYGVNNGSCMALWDSVCNSTSICDQSLGLICTDGKCACNAPLSQVWDAGRCRTTVGTACDAQTGPPCAPNAFCNKATDTCECIQNYTTTLKGPIVCKLGIGSPCSTQPRGISLCNHERGLVCKEKECACYDASLSYRNSTGICSNSVSGFCGTVEVRSGPFKVLGKLTEARHDVRIGCNQDLVCGRIQGHDSCRCLPTDTVQADRTFKIDYCLPSEYY